MHLHHRLTSRSPVIDWKLKGMRETVALSKAFQDRWPLRQRLSIIMKTGAYRRPTIIVSKFLWLIPVAAVPLLTLPSYHRRAV